MFWKKRQKTPVPDQAPVLPVLASDMSNLLPEVVAVVDEILDNAAAEEEKVERLKARGIRLLAPDAFQYRGHIYRSIGKTKWARIDADNHDAHATSALTSIPQGEDETTTGPTATLKKSKHPPGTEKKPMKMLGWLRDGSQDKLKKDLRNKNIVVLPNTAEGMEGGLLDLVHKTSIARSRSGERERSSETHYKHGVEILPPSAPSEGKATPGLIPHFASLKPQQPNLLSTYDRSIYSSESSASRRFAKATSENARVGKAPPSSYQTDTSSGTKVNEEHSSGISSNDRDGNSSPDIFNFELSGTISLERATAPPLRIDRSAENGTNALEDRPKKTALATLPTTVRPSPQKGARETIPSKALPSSALSDRIYPDPQAHVGMRSGNALNSDSKMARPEPRDFENINRPNNSRCHNPGHSVHEAPRHASSQLRLSDARMNQSNKSGLQQWTISDLLTPSSANATRREPRTTHSNEYLTEVANKLHRQGENSHQQNKISLSMMTHEAQDQTITPSQITSPDFHTDVSPQFDDPSTKADKSAVYDFKKENNQGYYGNYIAQGSVDSTSHLPAAVKPSEFARLKKSRELYHKRKEARYHSAHHQKQAVGTSNAA
ncbi:hypothetical protein ABW21_db0202060 [Orbilia brochopaga]|nr:hypothetical protein ABW21_db0202060 [Drechslerella brochopaga]